MVVQASINGAQPVLSDARAANKSVKDIEPDARAANERTEAINNAASGDINAGQDVIVKDNEV